MNRHIFFLLIANLFIGYSSNGQENRFSSFYGVGLFYYGIEVNEMPYIVRNVPIHPDDDYVDTSNAGPIEEVRYKKNFSFNALFGVEYKVTKSIKTKIGIDFILFGGSDLYERNYTNAVGTDKKGVGAALTYSGIGLKTFLPIGMTPRAGVEVLVVKDDYGGYLSVESSVSYFKLVGHNGWDRYEKLEKWHVYTLAHLYSLYSQLNWAVTREIVLSIGSQLIFTNLTTMGESSGIRYKIGNKNGIGFYFSLTINI